MCRARLLTIIISYFTALGVVFALPATRLHAAPAPAAPTTLAQVIRDTLAAQPPTPAATLTGEANRDRFGYSVASAGDVNGDGFSDIIAGAPFRDVAGCADCGQASIYHGSASGIGTTPATVLLGESIADEFATSVGGSVAGVGDVNGDGFADVLVGAPMYDAGIPDANRGRAYLYLGSTTGINPTPAAIFAGVNDNDQFGRNVAGAGDVNGDGFADIIIGAQFVDNPAAPLPSNFGRAYIFLGSATGIAGGLASIADIVLDGENEGDEFGSTVASAGDVNGDGFADVLVGAPLYGTRNTGRVYLFLGGATGTAPTPAAILDGAANGDQFGAAIAGAGDVNGDGFADVLVGAPLADAAGTPNVGSAYVFLGNAGGLDSTPAATIVGTQQDGRLGAAVAGAGDVNNDGFADVLVGIPLANGLGGNRNGQTDLYLGSAAVMTSTPARSITGTANNDRLGSSVGGAGNVNGDSFDDVIVGAPFADGGGNDRGSVAVYHGGPIAPTAVTLTAFGAQPTADGTRLTWETASEHQTAGYYVQRRPASSTDPAAWQRVSPFVAALGDGTTGAAYRWHDADPAHVGATYRLEEVTTAGDSVYYALTDVAASTPDATNRVWLPAIRVGR